MGSEMCIRDRLSIITSIYISHGIINSLQLKHGLRPWGTVIVDLTIAYIRIYRHAGRPALKNPLDDPGMFIYHPLPDSQSFAQFCQCGDVLGLLLRS